MTAVVLAPLAGADPGAVRGAGRRARARRRRDLPGRPAGPAGLPGRPAVPAGAGRVHGRRRGDHDRQPAREDHRRARGRRRVRAGDHLVRRQSRCCPLADGGAARPGRWPAVPAAAVAAAGAGAADRGDRRRRRWSASSRSRTRASRWSARCRPACRCPGCRTSQLGDLATLLLPALGIAIVGYTDNVLTGRAFGARQDQPIDANQEFIALGGGERRRRLSCRASRSARSGSRTALGEPIGSRTQLYSLVALVCVLLTLLVAGPLLASFPTAALGALVIYAAVRLVDVAEIPAHRPVPAQRAPAGRSAPRSPCCGLGVLYGVLVAVGLSIVDLVRRVARPHDGDPRLRAGGRRHARRRRLPEAPGSSRAGGLPLRRAAVLRQRRGLPPARARRRWTRRRTPSSGSC